LLGVKPALGRTFLPGDGSHDTVMVLSNGLWQRRFGGDPAILGKTVPFDGGNITIVGVLPADFCSHFRRIQMYP